MIALAAHSSLNLFGGRYVVQWFELVSVAVSYILRRSRSIGG